MAIWALVELCLKQNMCALEILDYTENQFNFSSCALKFSSWHVKLFYAAVSPVHIIINDFMHLTVLLSPLLHHISCTWLVSNLQLSQLSRQPKQILFIARKKKRGQMEEDVLSIFLSANYWRISAHFHINLSESVLINTDFIADTVFHLWMLTPLEIYCDTTAW